MPAFLTIVRQELTDILLSPFGQRLIMIHLGLVCLAVVFGWPASYVLGAANAAPTLAWWVYAEIIILSYLSLAVPAGIFPIDNKVRTSDWLVYGDASIWSVYFGKITATWLALAFWLLTVIPVAIVALAISPTSSAQLISLALFATLLFTTLIQVGTWLGVTFDSQTFRVVFVDIAFVLVMLASILAQSFADVLQAPISIQPLEVAARILNISARDVLIGSGAGTLIGLSEPLMADTAVSFLDNTSRNFIIITYSLICGCFAGLSLLSLWQWRKTSAKDGDIHAS